MRYFFGGLGTFSYTSPGDYHGVRPGIDSDTWPKNLSLHDDTLQYWVPVLIIQQYVHDRTYSSPLQDPKIYVTYSKELYLDNLFLLNVYINLCLSG